ncbi:MAG: ABC transporter ATP-binding protein [Nitrospiraceae bacterium]|nr:MAG: ABC transporter ATP-binding protein [Nitrospiraceae bacterium]
MEPLITVQNLNKSFTTPGSSLHVLKDISFEVQQGAMIALMGPSGVGKSTLLHILGTLDRPTSGSVLFEGVNVFELKDDALAQFRSRTVGFVFQFHHLMPEFNTFENTVMPALIAGINRGEADSRARQILSDVGLSERLLHKPGELSGGEQQRVAVARALMLHPKIVLADEPTGNLDTKTGEDLFKLLASLNSKGITFIIVTHNESLASNCGRTIRMKDGQIVG